MLNFVKTGQTIAEISRFFKVVAIRHLGFVCLPCFWTTHETCGVQNSVGIHAIVSIIRKFENFVCLAWKCLFTPPKLWFSVIWSFLAQPSLFILAWNRHQICWLAYPVHARFSRSKFPADLKTVSSVGSGTCSSACVSGRVCGSKSVLALVPAVSCWWESS